MPIEDAFDIAFVGNLARREKQIQQNYRPIIGVHKWFARRPGTLFRALLLCEFAGDRPLRDSFFHAHHFTGKVVGDPFMGGGTPLVEANRVGCNVIGRDVNPMAYWIVRQELVALDRRAFLATAEAVITELEGKVGRFYKTTCLECGNSTADVKYFLWVKQARCPGCGGNVDLFPGYLVATNDRHSHFVVVCHACRHVNELESLSGGRKPLACQKCSTELTLEGPASRGRCLCSRCETLVHYPQPGQGAPQHRMFAIEYHCSACRHRHSGRYFKAPDRPDLRLYDQAIEQAQTEPLEFVPDDAIPPGDETTRLHRWGYAHYRELFNARQLFGLNALAETIGVLPRGEVRFALATVLSDILRYQNMLVRYDTWALKALDIFSVHGYPVGLIQCESNLLGIPKVGSGGFRHFVEKYERAKAYCEQPFEVLYRQGQKVVVPVKGEKIVATLVGGQLTESRDPWAWVDAADGGSVRLPPEGLDAVFSDPPYFANVQYAELMDFCYVWLRKILRKEIPQFRSPSTRSPNELTGNETLGRTLGDFTDGLSRIFRHYSRALKPEAPLVFTYHHNKLEAYLPLVVAVLDASLICSATLPCPAEMGASIHINGTGSSTVDTVFVCRKAQTVASTSADKPQDVGELTRSDLAALGGAGLRPTIGDARCILFGHVSRLAIAVGRDEWDPHPPVQTRLQAARRLMGRIVSLSTVDDIVGLALKAARNGEKEQLVLGIDHDFIEESGNAKAPVRSTL